VLFPEDPADEDLMCGAQFVVVHDPLHALKSEFLQRTMPYFFKLKRHKRSANSADPFTDTDPPKLLTACEPSCAFMLNACMLLNLLLLVGESARS
jgi:hypothetical protein